MTQAEEIAALRRELADMRERLTKLEAAAPPMIFGPPPGGGVIASPPYRFDVPNPRGGTTVIMSNL